MSEVTIELTNRQPTYLERQFTLGADEDANSGSDAFGLMQKLRNAMGAEAYVPVVGDAVQTSFDDDSDWLPTAEDAYRRVVIDVGQEGYFRTRDTDGGFESNWHHSDGLVVRLDPRQQF